MPSQRHPGVATHLGEGVDPFLHLQASRQLQALPQRRLKLSLHRRIESEMEVVPRLRGLLARLAEYDAVGVDAVLDESFRSPELVVIEPLHTGLPNHIVATDARSLQVFG